MTPFKEHDPKMGGPTPEHPDDVTNGQKADEGFLMVQIHNRHFEPESVEYVYTVAAILHAAHRWGFDRCTLKALVNDAYELWAIDSGNYQKKGKK